MSTAMLEPSDLLASHVRDALALSDDELIILIAAGEKRLVEGGRRLTVISVDELPRGTPKRDTLASRLVRRWNKELHKVICGSDAEDEALRKELGAALVKGGAGAAAAIAAFLVLSGVDPILAAAIGALLSRVLVAPTVDELCRLWGERLQAMQ
jgi:hypothetical protein